MEAEFKLASNFKGIIEIISTFADNINIRFDQNGISIQALDSGNISMLNIQLFDDQFSEYTSKGTGFISMSATSLKPILKSMKDRDGLRMKLPSLESNTVDFILTDGDRKNKYSVKLMNIDIDMLNMDVEMDHDIFISTGKMAMSKILMDIKNLEGDDVEFIINQDDLHIQVNSDQCNLKIKPAKEIMRVMTPTEEDSTFRVKFSSKYIHNIHKMLSISQSRMNLKLDKSCPLLLEMTICSEEDALHNGNKKRSTMKYFLAPKLDDF